LNSENHFMRSVIFFIFITLGLSANPFHHLQDSLQDYTSSVFSPFDTKERQLKNLFASGSQSSISEESDWQEAPSGPQYLSTQPFLPIQVTKEKTEIRKKYIIKNGDTLKSVSTVFHVEAAKIKKINRMKSSQVKAGQVLEIPIPGETKYLKIVRKKIFVNPVPDAKLTSRYGSRKDPFNHYYHNFHGGIDMAAKVGTPIIASSDGEVVFTGRNGGFGNTVVIQHKNGFKTTYAHCSRILVESGDSVRMGRIIGLVGRTGNATGAHLHFEVMKNGRLMNPESALGMIEKIVTRADASEFAKHGS
jgi:murein DD-endopeptidase MepM/ murein hydrolase activator NlpD